MRGSLALAVWALTATPALAQAPGTIDVADSGDTTVRAGGGPCLARSTTDASW